LLSTFLDASENWRANSATLEHLSVHNGSVVRSLPCPQLLDNVQAKDWKDLKDGRRWWRMEWKSGGMEWEKPKVCPLLLGRSELKRGLERVSWDDH